MTDHVGLLRRRELPFVSFFKHSPTYGCIDNANCDLKIASLVMGKNYMYISITKTWPSAREYCIKLSMDLAVIENSEENAEVSSLKPNNDAIWIGLYRVPWTWSDKSQSSLENWKSSKPDNYLGNQHCVVENNLHKWDDDICTIKYVFICHQANKLQRKSNG
uniref:C-type lectin domain-containing protein n=1 Tax=Maylandia zebra TaxID=106582 RepID=A0A3P9CGS3_9CICH